MDWNRYDDQQNLRCYEVDTVNVEVVVGMFAVTDKQLLQNALDSHSLQISEDQPPECWAYDLFRQTRGQFARLADLRLSKNLDAKGFI